MVDDFGIGIEIGVHGRQWHAVHDGYFADPEVVLPFLDTISHEILNCTPMQSPIWVAALALSCLSSPNDIRKHPSNT